MPQPIEIILLALISLYLIVTEAILLLGRSVQHEFEHIDVVYIFLHCNNSIKHMVFFFTLDELSLAQTLEREA